MLLDVLETVLLPLIIPMKAALATYAELTDSTGIGVLLLALTVAIIIIPLQHYGRIVEQRLADKNARIKNDIRRLDTTLKGEERFHAIDAIYQRHGFHPIHNTLSGASFVFQLPFLIAAVLLFTDGTLSGHGFGVLPDLAKPDGKIKIGTVAINALPIFMLLLNYAVSRLYYANNKALRRRFVLLSTVLTVLIYTMPSGLVLYWMMQSLSSSLFARLRHRASNKLREA